MSEKMVLIQIGIPNEDVGNEGTRTLGTRESRHSQRGRWEREKHFCTCQDGLNTSRHSQRGRWEREKQNLKINHGFLR